MLADDSSETFLPRKFQSSGMFWQFTDFSLLQADEI